MTTAPDTVSRNAGFAFASKAVGAVFTAILTIVVVRVLGPTEYGTLTLAMSIGGLVFLPSDIGIAQAAARFVAESPLNRPLVVAIISDAVKAKLFAAGLVSLALAALAGPVSAAYGTPELKLPLQILAISLLAESFLLLYNALLQALGKISVYLRIATLESVTEALLTITIVLLGGGAAGAIAGRTAAYIFAAVYGTILINRTVGQRISIRRRESGSHMKRIFGYGSALLIIDGATTLFSRLDAILIGAIVSVPAVGQFGAAAQLAGLLGLGGQSVGAAVAPRMAQAENKPSDVRLLERSLFMTIILQGVFLAPLIVWAEPIVNLLLGTGFGEAADALRALAPFAFLAGISSMASLSVNYLGEARRRIPVAIAAVAINAAIDLIFLSKIGIVAAAIGTDVAYCIYVTAHLSILRRMAGLRVGPLVSAFVRVLIAAIAMSLVLLGLGTGSVPLPILVIGAPLGIGAYIVSLIALRAFSLADLRRATRSIRVALPYRRS